MVLAFAILESRPVTPDRETVGALAVLIAGGPVLTTTASTIALELWRQKIELRPGLALAVAERGQLVAVPGLSGRF